MKLKKVINLFGAPGCGKSTIASGLFYKMKINGYSVEYVTEYAKDCVFEERLNLLQEDQLYIFAKQNRKLFRLKDVYEYIIMDSPIFLSNFYFNLNSFYNSRDFFNLVNSTFNSYPNLNFFIELNESFAFETEGRLHDLNESKLMEEKLKSICYRYKVDFTGTFINDNSIINKIYEVIRYEQ